MAHSSALKSAPIDPKTLRKSAFARLLGITAGRVSQMITAGLPVEPDGRIDVARGRLWIQQNINLNQSLAQKPEGFDIASVHPPTAAAIERARLVKEQADAVALKNQIARRDLVKASEIEREWTAILRRVRAGILAVPTRLRQTSPHLTARDIAALDRELRAVLEELANAE